MGVGTHVRRCPRFFVFPDAPDHGNDHDWCGGDPSSYRFFFRFEHSPSLLQRVALRISVFYSNFSTLGEQFLTPSLESVSIHIVPSVCALFPSSSSSCNHGGLPSGKR